MRTALLIAAACCLLSPAIRAADAPTVTKRTALSFRLDVPEPDSVAKARLYISEDNGLTWKGGEEVGRGELKSPLPRLRFTADHDGTYGFNTRVTYVDQHADPEPQPGQAPDYEVVVDTKPPVIEAFDATLISAGNDSAAVNITWRIDDLHLYDEQCAVLEASADGTDFTVVQRSGKTEDRTVTIKLAADQRHLLLLLSAADQAENETVSPIRTLEIPERTATKPQEPAVLAASAETDSQALDQALSALPILAESPTSDEKLEQPEISQAPVPLAKAPEAAPLAAAPAKPAADAPDRSLENEFHQRMESDGENRNTSALWKGGGNAKQMRLEDPAESKPKKEPALREAAKKPSIEPALSGLRAQSLLNQARAAATSQDYDRAEDSYARLRQSDIAAQALPEELRMLTTAGRAAQALQIIEQLPPISYTDPVRLEHGKILVAAGRHEEGVAALVKIGRGSDSAPAALYQIAMSYVAQHKDVEAKRVLQYLTKQRGDIGAAAEAQLRNLP